MEAGEQTRNSETRLIKGILLGCGILALLVVGGCVALVYFLLRTASKITDLSYEPPPPVEVSSSYTNPELIRLFLGIASPKEVKEIPSGSYRLTEGEINAYLTETFEKLPGPIQIRVKIDSDSLLIYCSMKLVEKESAETHEKPGNGRGLLPENLKVSYSGKLKVASDDNGVRLAVVSFKTGKLPETVWSPQSNRDNTAQRALLPGAGSAIGGTDVRKILRIIFEGLSYGAEVASIELQPLEVRIQIAKEKTSSSS